MQKEIAAKRSGKGHLDVERTAVVDVEQETNDVQEKAFVFALQRALPFGRNGRVESDADPVDRMRNGEDDQHDDLNGEKFDQLVPIAMHGRRLDGATRATNVPQGEQTQDADQHRRQEAVEDQNEEGEEDIVDDVLHRTGQFVVAERVERREVFVEEQNVSVRAEAEADRRHDEFLRQGIRTDVIAFQGGRIRRVEAIDRGEHQQPVGDGEETVHEERPHFAEESRVVAEHFELEAVDDHATGQTDEKEQEIVRRDDDEVERHRLFQHARGAKENQVEQIAQQTGEQNAGAQAAVDQHGDRLQLNDQ